MKLFSKKKNNQAQENISIDNLQSEIKILSDEESSMIVGGSLLNGSIFDWSLIAGYSKNTYRGN